MKPLTTVAALILTVSVASSAQAQIQTQSGLLLGVYVQAVSRGMYVTSTIPGYSAVGRLQQGDVLVRATAQGMPVYDLQSLRQLEMAKSSIGPNREAAIEFFRPGQGLLYAWVEFTPLFGPAAASPTGVKQYGAQFKLESEKPGARNLFHKGNGNSGGNGQTRPNPQGSGNPFDRFNTQFNNANQFGDRYNFKPNHNPTSNAPSNLFNR